MSKKSAKTRISKTGLATVVKTKADYLNKEKYPSYQRELKEEFIAVLLTNQMRDTFYANAKDLSKDAIETHKKMIDKDLAFYIKALAYARNYGYARLQPQVGLVNLSTKDMKAFRRVFKKVCLIPTDLKDFIDFAKSGVFRKGLGTGVKKAINSWLRYNLSEYYALKYGTELRDAIRMARPSEKYIGDKSLIVDWLMENPKNLNKLPQISAFEKLKVSKDNKEILELISDGKLPLEIVTPFIKTREQWRELAKQMPYFALVRNLNTLRRHGCFDKKFTEFVAKKLANEEVILKSKVYPFRFYDAYRMVSSTDRKEYYPERDYLKGKPVPRPENLVPELLEGIELEEPATVETFNKEIPEEVKEALEQAFKISFKNVPEIKGKTAVAVDVSGSMQGKYKEIAATLGMGLLMKAQKKGIICFDDKLHIVEIDLNKPLKTIERVCEAGNGGTNISLPVQYLTDNKINVDNIVIISDMEEWIDEGFLESFTKYKDKINPNVKAFLINISPYKDYPAPSKTENVYVIGGWNDQVLNYIALITSMGDQIKAIEQSDAYGEKKK